MLVALIGVALADAQSNSPGATRHLLLVPDTPEGVAALARTDGRVLARYDAFTLVEAAGADDTALRQAGADRRDDMSIVETAAGEIDPRDQRTSLADKTAPDRQETLALVQFVGPPKESWIERLRDTGARVVTYQPQNAYVVHARDNEVDRLAALVGTYAPVRSVSVLTAADKLEAPTSPTGQYAVQTLTGGDGQDARDEAAQAGGEVGDPATVGPLRTEYRELSAAEAEALARDPAVVAIEPYVQPQLADERGAQIVAGNLTGFAPSAPGYLSWLTGPGRIPDSSTFDFAIDITDEGLDDAAVPAPLDHADFYEGGSGSNPSRVAYLNDYTGDANATDCGGHGTNVASIAAGYNNGSGAPAVEDAAGYNHGLGVAPFAQLGASKIFECDGSASAFDAIALTEAAYAGGARISNNSWGTAVWGSYGTRSQQYDAVVRDASSVADDQEMVQVFAAGNDGEGNAGGFNEGYATILSEATAKNVITVGAAEGVRASGTDGCGTPDSGADSARDIIDFSSRGPTDDGRLKPDLVAPGTHVTGARPRHGLYPRVSPPGTCNPIFGGGFYSLVSGTSQATPHVSGAAALVRRWYTAGPGAGLPPSPALTKALLVNTAADLAGGSNGKGSIISAGPNTDQGWGRVNVGDVFDSTAREFRDQADLLDASGQQVLQTYDVQDPSKPVKVTLVWTDAPGNITGNAWKNDLDLVVEARGETYKGNAFAGAFSRTGGSADPRNNVESVYLPAGAAGRIAVKVVGATVGSDGVPGVGDSDDQDFALVVSNAEEQPGPVLVHQSTALSDPGGDNDNTFESDEEIHLTEAVRNAGTVGATGLSAVLSSDTPAMTVTQANSLMADLGAGATGSNPTAFEAELENAAICGTDVPATIDIATTGPVTETHTIPLTLTTGETGSSLQDNASLGGGLTIPDDSAAGLTSTVTITERGRIKDLNVRFPGTAISHNWIGDLVIDLIGPDGTTVRLVEHPGGPDNGAKDFINVTFDDEAAGTIPAGVNPTGSYRPQNDQLSRFDGKSRRGTWTLRVRDLFEGDIGSLYAWGTDSRKAVCDFDTTAPDASLDGFPGTPTNQTAATFAFSSSDATASFECQLDSAAYVPCTTPHPVSGLSSGVHTFRVRAVDGSGNETPPGSIPLHTWTVDTTPPDTSISSGPPAFTTSDSAQFDFASELNASYECKLDSAAFAPCTSPKQYTGVVEGPHTFQVRATDLAGNLDSTPATRSWTVDTVAPAPSLSAPAGTTRDRDPLLRGVAGQATGDEVVVTVRIYSGTPPGDPPAATPIHTLPATVNPDGTWSVEVPDTLALGTYTAQVHQEDGADNEGRSGLFSFVVVEDAMAPTLALTAPVSGSSTADTTPLVTGTGGTAEGDDDTVAVKLWNGTLAAGLPAQTLIVPRDGATGAFSALPAALSKGVWTVRAEQGDSAVPENVGQSAFSVFTVGLPDPPPPAEVAPGFVLAPAEEKLSDVRRGRYRVLAACASACSVTARLSMSGASEATGSGRTRLTRAGTAVVKVSLSRAAKAALAERSSAKARLSVTVKDGTRRLTLSKSISLRSRAGLRRIANRGLRLWAVCSQACPLRGRITMSAARARKFAIEAKGSARVEIASGRLAAGRARGLLTLNVKASAKDALRAARRMSARLEATAGAAPKPKRTGSRRLTMRR